MERNLKKQYTTVKKSLGSKGTPYQTCDEMFVLLKMVIDNIENKGKILDKKIKKLEKETKKVLKEEKSLLKMDKKHDKVIEKAKKKLKKKK